jgi:hypothetical protein
MADGERPKPGGWNRIHFIVDDVKAEVARLRAGGAQFRNEIVRATRSRRYRLPRRIPIEIELLRAAVRAAARRHA